MSTNETKLPELANGRVLQILNTAVPNTRSRAPTDDEIAAGQQELAKVIGKKDAALPSWTRRLVLAADGTWLLKVDGITGVWPSPGCGFPIALSIPDAVELLRSAQNPEIALEHARQARAKEAADEAERQRQRKAELARARAAKEKLERERADFKADEWAMLNSFQRLGVRLALAVENRDPELAADIRAAVAASLATDDVGDFPRATWHTGLGLDKLTKTQQQAALMVAEAERDEHIVATVPSADRAHLRLMRGAHNSRDMAEAVRSLREIRGPEFMSYDAKPGAGL